MLSARDGEAGDQLRQLPARLRRALRPWLQSRVNGGLVDERSVRRIARRIILGGCAAFSVPVIVSTSASHVYSGPLLQALQEVLLLAKIAPGMQAVAVFFR